MKYGELKFGQMEAIVNKLGGMEGVHRFLRGELTVAPPSPDRVLDFVTEVKFPGTTDKFIARDKFVVDARPEAKVKISCLGDDFKKWFLDKIEEPEPETTLNVHELRGNSLDDSIIAELGGQRKAATTLREIFSLMKKQGHGEAGTLFANGLANLFYVRGQDGALRAVCVYWSGDSWRVYAFSVLNPGDWSGGYRVFSRQ